ncbi:MAG TPA: HypC/HybG/HupF family hydrogenase formation chaperone [Capsulimonadaceae bacterium]
MCLAVPGQIVSIVDNGNDMTKTAKVNFSGITKDISLVYVPEAVVGDFVLVHVGFALQLVDPEEAAQVFEYLRQMGELDELTDADDARKLEAV